MLIGARFQRIENTKQAESYQKFDFLNINGATHYHPDFHPIVREWVKSKPIRFNNLINPDKSSLLNGIQPEYALLKPALNMALSCDNHAVSPFTINVFNEILRDTGEFRFSNLNLDSLIRGFTLVKEQFPDVSLGFSDYRLFMRSNAKFESYYRLIEQINNQAIEGFYTGSLVGAFSMQIWRYVNDLQIKRDLFLKSLANSLRTFADMGIKTHISECAIFVNQHRHYERKPSLALRTSEQAKYYTEIMDVCKSNGCESFCFWQPFDANQETLRAFQKQSPIDNTGIFDMNYDLKSNLYLEYLS